MSDSYFYDTLPKKRMAAGALLLDEQGNILIVKPTYRPDWLLPGGSIEEDESPRAGCEREVQEEIGLDIPTISLLSIDYVSRVPDKNESVQFIFYSGVLSAEQIQRITLPPDELSEYRFVPVAEAEKLLSPRLAVRMAPSLHALKEGTTAYLEDGRETWAPAEAVSS
ncbi:MAG: NUDIX hydrolase [Ktedonobacteraceae bacterium]|nr:NUDIX hydrolase [Ktedonobacteraceae bacterium]